MVSYAQKMPFLTINHFIQPRISTRQTPQLKKFPQASLFSLVFPLKTKNLQKIFSIGFQSRACPTNGSDCGSFLTQSNLIRYTFFPPRISDFCGKDSRRCRLIIPFSYSRLKHNCLPGEVAKKYNGRNFSHISYFE